MFLQVFLERQKFDKKNPDHLKEIPISDTVVNEVSSKSCGFGGPSQTTSRWFVKSLVNLAFGGFNELFKHVAWQACFGGGRVFFSLSHRIVSRSCEMVVIFLKDGVLFDFGG